MIPFDWLFCSWRSQLTENFVLKYPYWLPASQIAAFLSDTILCVSPLHKRTHAKGCVYGLGKNGQTKIFIFSYYSFVHIVYVYIFMPLYVYYIFMFLYLFYVFISFLCFYIFTFYMFVGLHRPTGTRANQTHYVEPGVFLS